MERVYWWQLKARGYGLLTSASQSSKLQKRPSFHALATLDRQLRGCTFMRPLEAPPGARLLLFNDADGGNLAVGWSTSGTALATLPAPAVSTLEQDGRGLETPPSREIGLSEAVRYFRF